MARMTGTYNESWPTTLHPNDIQANIVGPFLGGGGNYVACNNIGVIPQCCFSPHCQIIHAHTHRRSQERHRIFYELGSGVGFGQRWQEEDSGYRPLRAAFSAQSAFPCNHSCTYHHECQGHSSSTPSQGDPTTARLLIIQREYHIYSCIKRLRDLD